MFPPALYVARRQALAEAVGSGVVVLLGNDVAPMNYQANAYRFHQDGSFLYYTGLDAPGLALLLDAETGKSTLFGHDPTLDDVIWEGPLTPLAERATGAGIERTAPPEALEEVVSGARSAGRAVHVLPPYRGGQALTLGRLLGTSPYEIAPSEILLDAVVAQRLIKTDEEVDEIERAVGIAAEMHRTAMRMAHPGRTEWEIAGAVEGVALAAGGYASYGVILTRRGEVLHNHATDYTLQEGDLMLVDAGLHAPYSRYASDITRTSPVGGRFSDKQRALYEVVLDAQLAALAACRPGVAFRDVHLVAARAVAEGLKGLGLMKGDPEEAVAVGAHALFFPHGLGHALGLDVHDLEGLGEDRVGYGGEAERSGQFGLAALRFARRLQPGHVVTVEPGVYLIGPLLDQWEAERRLADFVDYDALGAWRGLGGVRIEDNVAITEDGARVLGPGIPKTPEAVEAEVQAGAA